MSAENVNSSLQNPLSPGEWEVVLFQAPSGIRALVTRLAVHHGHLKPCAPSECPVCSGQPAGTPEQLPLEIA